MLRFCWTMVLVFGLVGLNAAGWYAYKSTPTTRSAPVPPPIPPETLPIIDKDKTDKDAGEKENVDKDKSDKDKVEKPPKPTKPAEYDKQMTAGNRALVDGRWDDAEHNFTEAIKAWSDGRPEAEKGIATARKGRVKEKVDEKLTEAKGLIAKRRLLGAKLKLDEALLLDKDDDDVKSLSADVNKRLARASDYVKEGKSAQADKDYKKARDKYAGALLIDDENDEARGLLRKVEALLMPPAKLKGSVLVLMLHTQTSSLNTDDFRSQLKQAEKELGADKKLLLGEKVYVLDKTGAKPWTAATMYLDKDALDNREFPALIEAVKAGVKKMQAQAERKEPLNVVLVWETNNKPDAAVELPKAHYRLAYRNTVGDDPIPMPDGMFAWVRQFKMEKSMYDFLKSAVTKAWEK